MMERTSSLQERLQRSSRPREGIVAYRNLECDVQLCKRPMGLYLWLVLSLTRSLDCGYGGGVEATDVA